MDHTDSSVVNQKPTFHCFLLEPLNHRESIHVIEEEASRSIDLSFLQLIFLWQIGRDDDVLWVADTRERNEDVAARGRKFLNWLWTRKEKEIAIVTHSGFLYHTLSEFGRDCHPSVKTEICKHFANCELRSVVLVDRSMMGSDPATTNYPGKIPSGLDLPSDVATEKLSEEGNGN
ncbi:Phosphoglycerate mutase-like protein 2 [Hibiscus syriacus]|uniref:Phosphoglycerate mutase-like protein 2 n=1 Tax=Hibiscus syriacus TaxID=106335 RepID=A0A6A3BFD7_HIBSY|nr:Phosphoglycerate mutase-like protein 2 [Hibiscus syriacus]